ncbi:hypothetical protein [Nonlabens dokdonensis]|uniref:Uncharacterized protein n=1 Tax=Nonlabens dokdonensis (strain DSM 17205 / KCTC 12402 / DSW-6) TaxID=592029 RepID=L7WAB5_NONDD|nr:hypothetical protein [Nonlabens dokdonensis]AGC78630.1 hypothetical protein DDD_3503 [Nonlabens dokdonensis DSW-6]
MKVKNINWLLKNGWRIYHLIGKSSLNQMFGMYSAFAKARTATTYI